MTRSVPTAVPFPEDEEAVLSLGRALREDGTPSWPWELSPQHHSDPSVRVAQVFR